VEGGTSFFTSGIDPGYGNAGITIGALGLCKDVRRVRMMEIVNYATWDNPFTMFEIMGFGKPDPSRSLLLAPGSTTMAWGPVVALVAESMGLELDEITERNEVVLADQDVEIASGTVEAGTISGMRFEIIGMVDGEERVVVEHVTRLQDGDAPDWPTGEGYRILVEGEPHVKVEVSVSSDRGDHNHAGCLATAMHVVNAIPAVVAADPGVLTLLDLTPRFRF
jgi:4-hydroxy-tetrahydrodipicolinate reductase